MRETKSKEIQKHESNKESEGEERNHHMESFQERIGLSESSPIRIKKPFEIII
jgi:hypothetical protein